MASDGDCHKPIGRALGYRQADNQWHDYAGLDRLPRGFVPTGDAVCAFNPVYGQGMTIAVLEAREDSPDFSTFRCAACQRSERFVIEDAP